MKTLSFHNLFELVIFPAYFAYAESIWQFPQHAQGKIAIKSRRELN